MAIGLEARSGAGAVSGLENWSRAGTVSGLEDWSRAGTVNGLEARSRAGTVSGLEARSRAGTVSGLEDWSRADVALGTDAGGQQLTSPVRPCAEAPCADLLQALYRKTFNFIPQFFIAGWKTLQKEDKTLEGLANKSKNDKSEAMLVYISTYRVMSELIMQIAMSCINHLIEWILEMAHDSNMYVDLNFGNIKMYTEDAISLALHLSLEHLDNKDTYVRLLFIDYTSAFNTTVTSRLISKLRDPWSWLHPLQLDPQLSDPQPTISEDSKSKELIIDFRKKGGEHAPICNNGAEVERVESIKFLRVTITNNLSWTSHVGATVKKAQQHLFFLRWLRKFGMS
eukprot:g42480.t1